MTIKTGGQENYRVYSHRHYHLHLALFLFISVTALLGLLSAFIEFILRGAISASAVIGSATAFIFGLLLLFDTVNTLLVISSEGIEYRRGGYTITISWQDIERTEVKLRKRLEHVLKLKRSTLKANCLQSYLLQVNKGDLMIPLALFEVEWHRTEIGDLIRHYAPHTNVPR
jgi:hypothetical protein